MRTVPVSANLTRFLPLFLPLEREIATSAGKNGILPKNRIIPERGPRRIARMRTNNLPNQPRRDSSLRAFTSSSALFSRFELTNRRGEKNVRWKAQ